MICPQCEVEYRTGFTQCADCDLPLVDRARARCAAFAVEPVSPENYPPGSAADQHGAHPAVEAASSDELGDLLEVLEDGEIPYAVLAGTALRRELTGKQFHRHDAPDPWHARILVPGARWEGRSVASATGGPMTWKRECGRRARVLYRLGTWYSPFHPPNPALRRPLGQE